MYTHTHTHTHTHVYTHTHTHTHVYTHMYMGTLSLSSDTHRIFLLLHKTAFHKEKLVDTTGLGEHSGASYSPEILPAISTGKNVIIHS